MIQNPNLVIYGMSFGEKQGSKLNSAKAQSIDRDKLNKNTLSDTLELTYFEETIKDFVLARLGHPVVRVELTPLQIKMAIDEAITELYYFAPFWTKQMAVFEAVAGENVYEIPRFILDNLEFVSYRKTLFSVSISQGTLEFDFFLKFWQDNFFRGSFAVGEYYLMQQYLETVRKVLGLDGTWQVLNNQYLKISPTPTQTPEYVILEYRAIDSDTIHPKFKNWLQRYTLAICKEILGEIRGKYEILPGPGGGSKLNGKDLIERGQREKGDLKEELTNEITEPTPLFIF